MAVSLGTMETIMEIISAKPERTSCTESFAKYCKWGRIITNFSGEIILINFVKDVIEADRTSFSASRSRFVKI